MIFFGAKAKKTLLLNNQGEYVLTNLCKMSAIKAY